MTSYLVLLGILVCFSAILALALNFQWGLGGMVNFGLTGFYALGAYASALFMLKAGANSFFAVVGAIAVVAAVCAVVAFVTLRVTEEDYFAIVTLGVGEMLRLVALNEDWLTKGALGLTGVPRPFGDRIAPEYYQYFLLALAIALLLATLWFLNAIARSPLGRLVRSVREDDVVAATLGKNVLWARVRIFAIGGGIIGLAGSMHGFYYQYIDPTQFTNIVVAYAFMAVIAGGRGAHGGAIFGAAAVMALLEGSRFLKDLVPALDSDQLAAIRIIIIGVGLIALLIYRPQGFLREYRLKVSPYVGEMDKNRRRIIKSIGAATASSLAAPYLNLAHAQGSPIPLGVALPLTGNAGAYGPDMAEAAKRTAAKINAGGGVLGRKLELFIEDSESSAAVAANLSHKFINVHKAQAL